jgi:hypothetical protein
MNDNFFDWWEAFTELAYSKNLIIEKTKDFIRDKWYDKEFSIEDAIKKYTR